MSSMVWANRNFQMVPTMKEILSKVIKRVRDITSVSQGCMKDSSRLEISTEKGPLPILIIEFIKEGGSMVCSRAMASSLGLMETGTRASIRVD